MESHILGRSVHFTSSDTSLSRKIQEILILSLICSETLLVTLSVTAAAASVTPDQEQSNGKQLGTDLSSNAQQSPTVLTDLTLQTKEQVTFGYKQIEWSNGTAIHSTTVKCLVQKSNETFGDYRFSMSIGDGIYILGFIGVLIILKSLLTKITMVENKPEASDYVMSTCATHASYKITLHKCTNNNNVLMTPPNSPCMGQPLSPSITSTPVSYSGTRCYPLSRLDGGRLYYAERSLFSSPDSSTKSLV